MLGDCDRCKNPPDECNCLRGGATLEQLITEVKVLRLQPGDVVVLKSDDIINSGLKEPIERASVAISRFVGFRVAVMVIPQTDAEIEVLRSGDGQSLLPHEVAAQTALKPIPPQMDTGSIPVIKSRTPGGLSGVLDALTAEDDSK